VFLDVDLGVQADAAARMVIAAILGAAIGIEREIHEHPAGMRTHLLVSLGSAAFTVVGAVGFGGSAGATTVDPSRVAAQIVTGIGFLGAGAILKYGTSVRGLTTAASLWTTAAVGMAAGAGEWFLALVATAIVLISLWPLRAVTRRIRPTGSRAIRVRLEAGRLEALGDISRLLAERRVDLAGVNSQRLGKGRYEVELELRLPTSARDADIIGAITKIPDVELLESATDRE
jgi:putative Mg2+ transporter-C (MgtC) family protein